MYDKTSVEHKIYRVPLYFPVAALFYSEVLIITCGGSLQAPQGRTLTRYGKFVG